MPVRYRDLTETQRCIYQSFTRATGVTDTAQAMADHVNSLGIDADDEDAVITLAKKYGFTQIEGVKGGDVDNEEYRFDTNAEIIAVITGNATVRMRFSKFFPLGSGKGDGVGLMKSVHDAAWHAIYGRSNGANIVAWHDHQRIYRNGPTGTNVAVCFIKR
jgi:hypothetical protein